MDLASIVDHTILKPETPLGAYTQGVRDCINYKFHSLCVNSFHVPLVSSLLHSYIHTDMNVHVEVASTVGFPFGTSSIESKVAEMQQAFNDGATEFDFVMNLSAARTGDWKRVKDEFVSLRNAVPDFLNKFHPILKVILEVGTLTDEEIKRACDIAVACHLDFVKTSTGFHVNKLEPKQTARYVKLMADQVKGSPTKVKASGGIKTLADVNLMLENGANRVGTSNSIAIMEQFLKENGQTQGK
jgi:deoxyribose-phosphate aldolase